METSLPAEPLSASKARDFVCQHLAAHGLAKLVEDVRLVASELATNALVHAGTPFVVSLSEVDGFLFLTVRDASASSPVRTACQGMDVCGRGLQVVEMLSQDWGADADGSGAKRVWASFSTATRRGARPSAS